MAMEQGNTQYKKYVKFEKNIVIVGFGSIGQGILALILRHIDVQNNQITIITADNRGFDIAKKENINFYIKPLVKENYKAILQEHLTAGDFLLNLSVDVSSADMITWCQENEVLYLDTVIEPWLGGYSDASLSITDRSNYWLRETITQLKNKQKKSTAVSAHWANPWIVSHFVKRALITIAKDTNHDTTMPKTRWEWGKLMNDLWVKVIHIAEYDSQVGDVPKKIWRFENTWSVDGFYCEGINQACELWWGTHEKYFPIDWWRHLQWCGAGIYLNRPGALTLVRTWTPEHGPFLGRIVTHNESISIADYFSIKTWDDVLFRPTVHYAYRPCDSAILSLLELAGNNLQQQKEQRILMDEIVSGMDELWVLLMWHKKGVYWYGSQLTIEEARRLAPYQNATWLQVTAAVLGGMIWAMENPNAGIVDADEIDFERVMEIAEPYLGTMKGEYSDWTPIKDRNISFPSEIDSTDPWQFKNFRYN